MCVADSIDDIHATQAQVGRSSLNNHDFVPFSSLCLGLSGSYPGVPFPDEPPPRRQAATCRQERSLGQPLLMIRDRSCALP